MPKYAIKAASGRFYVYQVPEAHKSKTFYYKLLESKSML